MCGQSDRVLAPSLWCQVGSAQETFCDAFGSLHHALHPEHLCPFPVRVLIALLTSRVNEESNRSARRGTYTGSSMSACLLVCAIGVSSSTCTSLIMKLPSSFTVPRISWEVSSSAHIVGDAPLVADQLSGFVRIASEELHENLLLNHYTIHGVVRTSPGFPPPAMLINCGLRPPFLHTQTVYANLVY